MRLHSTAALWALLASTAPASITAEGRRLRRKLVAQKECTIVAAELLAVELGASEDDDDDMIIECELDPSDAGGYSGIIVPIEASASQISELKSLINSGSITSGVDKLDIVGESIIETMGAGGKGAPETTVRISSTGSIKEKVQHPPAAVAAKAAKHQRRLADTTGTLNMLLVRVTDSVGVVYPDLPALMSDEVFGTGTADQVNLKSGLEECSWNQLTVAPGIGDSNEVAEGVIEVTIPIPFDGSSSTSVRNAVTTAVQTKLGHSLPGPYDYVLYSLEDCYDGCGWAAYAYVNSWLSVYRKQYYKRPGVLMHEIGHNFGLAHSGGLNGQTYTDHTCTMGNPHYSDEMFQCFNPAKNFQLNWYDDAELLLDPRSNGFSQTVTFVGIDEYPDRGSNPVVARLETGSGADYFVGFNHAGPDGPNRFNDEGDNQVTVIQVNGNNGNSYSQSYLRARMDAGGSFTLPGLSVTVTVDSIDLTTSPATAVVTITGPGGPATPPPTAAPCPSGEKRVEVQILTDNYPSETTWTLTEKCSGSNNVEMSGGPYSNSATEFLSNECVPDVEYDFKINDSWGDGICCSYGEGEYSVKFGNEVVASGGQFGSTETTNFGECQTTPSPPPTTGSTPLPTTANPTSNPTNPPSPPPTTANPTSNPTNPPSSAPSKSPTAEPTSSPSKSPTAEPTSSPTSSPSKSPTASPSSSPTQSPTTANPTAVPTSPPSSAPGPPTGSVGTHKFVCSSEKPENSQICAIGSHCEDKLCPFCMETCWFTECESDSDNIQSTSTVSETSFADSK